MVATIWVLYEEEEITHYKKIGVGVTTLTDEVILAIQAMYDKPGITANYMNNTIKGGEKPDENGYYTEDQLSSINLIVDGIMLGLAFVPPELED